MVYNFKLNDISRLSTSSSIYYRGVDYYKKKRVRKISHIAVDNKNVVTAVVEGSGDDYTVSVGFGENGRIKDYDCECIAFQEYSGICKHIVALLLQVYYTNSYEGSSSSGVTVAPRSDSLAVRLVEELEKHTLKKLSPTYVGISDDIGKIMVVPKLIYKYNNRLYIEITVGSRRQYIVRNIHEFAKCVINSSNYAYGKNLEFNHSIDSFSEDSRQIVELIVSTSKEYAYYYNMIKTSSYVYFPYEDSRQLPLQGSYFDAFFEIMLGKAIDAEVYKSKIKTIHFSNENPPIKFSLKKSESGARLKLEKGDIISITGEKYSYFLSESSLYRLDKQQSDILEQVINALYREEVRGLNMVGRTLDKFFVYLLPELTKLDMIEVDDEIYNSVELRPLDAKIYLDMYSGNLFCDLEYNYGDVVFDKDHVNGDIDNSVLRDSLKEHQIKAALERMKFIKTDNEFEYYMSNDEHIFDFLNGTADYLDKLADVYVSDVLKEDPVRQSVSFNVGLRFKGEMLELTFDTSVFDSDELRSILEACHSKRKYYRLKDGTFLTLENNDVSEVAQLLDGLDISSKDISRGYTELPKYRTMFIDSLLRQNSCLNITRDEATEELARKLRDFSRDKFKLPEYLESILRPYQKTGFQWISSIGSFGFGGILADDMGLGKTLQVISVLCYEKESGTKLPSIVIAPTSVVYNWQDEFRKFAPHMNSLIISGTASKRKELIGRIDSYDIAITSYDILKRDIEAYADIKFRYEIIDEAQNIKNYNTLNARAVKKIKSELRIALTGTPIENSLTELWSIFDFLMPGYLFSSSRFQSRFEQPIVKNNDSSKVAELKKHIAPFILRRLKKDVLSELPEKIESIRFSEMTPEQKKIYAAFILKARGDLEVEISNRGFEKSQIKILSLLTRMRQICCHPSLFMSDYTGESGKFELLLELINESLASNHRILLFSQFTTMLGIISNRLDKMKIGYFYLDGATPAETRIQMVRKFNGGMNSVFLISLKAGGVGLNLTGADVVIHYDPWWNPAVQNQATDRAYRIGQLNNVQVFNLVTKDSIEEKIMSLQERKQDLVDSVISEGSVFMNKLTLEDIRELFNDAK